MGSHAIIVSHTFEAAHRLPQLGGQCWNLHGHSWKVSATVSSSRLAADGTVVEFGRFKAGLRRWIDDHLDHAAMLGVEDPLLAILRQHDSKTFAFGGEQLGEELEHPAAGLMWPTVEAVAVVVHRAAVSVVLSLEMADEVVVDEVTVDETATNRAVYLR